MKLHRQLLLWGLAAAGASVLLAGVLQWSHRHAQVKWGNFLLGDPHEGFHLFQEKGCARCHSVNGVGGRSAPDLGYQQPPPSGLEELVAAMWNHAPRMWERMRKEKLPYPDLNYEEMAHLFAYLYTARYVDEPGDIRRGGELFSAKGCNRCHALYGVGGKVGPDLSSLAGIDTPIAWAQAMWNHAPAMETELDKLGLPWPRFERGEMNDLLAYIREVTAGPRREFELLPANSDRGWQLFRSKSCIVCHSVQGQGGRVGPELGPRRELPLTMVQFAGLMLNHSPEMWRAMKARNLQRPTFTGHEMADLIAYLHGVHYFEPGGSPRMGEVLFAKRHCSNCHGLGAEGTASGPALRGRGRNFTSVTLATALWRHGPEMEQRAQKSHLPWPELAESDVRDLLIFLNMPPTQDRRGAPQRNQ